MKFRNLLLMLSLAWLALHSTLLVAQEVAVNDSKILEVESFKSGVVSSERICESSGLSASRSMPEHFWTHNDSGNKEELFLIDHTGVLKAVIRLNGIQALDIEDMCHVVLEQRNYLLIADVGDNTHRRKSCQLFLIEEPTFDFEELDNETKVCERKIRAIKTITLKYENGSRDCESVGFDASRGHVWLMTKEATAGSRVSNKRSPGFYRFKLDPELKDRNVEAKLIATSDFPMTTSMDFSMDSQIAVIQSYTFARLYRRPDGFDWEHTFKHVDPELFGLPSQRQGESICFGSDNRTLWLTSETIGQPIWRLRLP